MMSSPNGMFPYGKGGTRLPNNRDSSKKRTTPKHSQ